MATTIHKITGKDNRNITITLKSNAINIFQEPQNNLWTFDLEGRLVGMFINGINYRRTLNNNFYQKSRIHINGEAFRQVEDISTFNIKPLFEKSFAIINDTKNLLPIEFKNPIDRILKMDLSALNKIANQFSTIYRPISILPPDQYMSLVIQLTEGCNYNKCTFCNFYRDRPFKIKSETELENHLDQIIHFFGDGISLRKSLFLADANALVVPQNRLVNSLVLINNKFPLLKNIYSFIDIFTGLKKTASDFIQLNSYGVKRAYLGVESGNNDLMLFLNKEQLNSDIIELSNNLKMGNINIGIILLVGAGGDKYSKQHLQDSVELLNQLPLGKGDIIYLSELYDINKEYADAMKNNNIELPTKLQIRQWSNEFRNEIKKKLPKKVQVAVYDINQFFY